MISEDDPPPATGAGAGGEGIEGGRLQRTAPLARLAGRTAGEAVVSGLRKRLTGADCGEFHVRTAERYAELLGRSKGALMKAGQLLSISLAAPAVPAEFRAVYQNALSRLRDQAPPMAPELARQVLERELGSPAERAFAQFDWEPLAAASIGQVHAARLHDGRQVAVKIQYPGVGQAIATDLKNTELLVTFLNLLGALSAQRMKLDMRGAAREMGARITEELDYRVEAANQSEFAAHYRGHPSIHIPEVVAELSTGRVLTQELCTGLTWEQALRSPQELRDLWAEAIWRFVYGSHRRFGISNLDPHPGNYLFHDDGSVSFLDFGCVKRYRLDQVDLITGIVGEAMRGEVQATWRLCVEAGYWRSSDPVSPEEVFDWWHEPFRYGWDRQPFTITPEYAASCIERRVSPTGPSGNALRHATLSPEFSAWPRVEVALISVLGALRATGDWAALYAEYHTGAAPVSAMGRAQRDLSPRIR